VTSAPDTSSATVRRARQLAAGLSVFDVALGLLLAGGIRPVVRILGEEPGFSLRWGVGQLLGYAAIEAYAAAFPSAESLLAVAALRAVAAPADLAAARAASPGMGTVLRGVACFNAAATAVFMVAGDQLRGPIG
jgi:hypothetical protein